ncbi:MAG: hypothetical protein KGJ06_01005 [Pseudomonadota bacterium]|nr:hypothetical protein [Pseudomonadota bacterium]
MSLSYRIEPAYRYYQCGSETPYCHVIRSRGNKAKDDCIAMLTPSELLFLSSDREENKSLLETIEQARLHVKKTEFEEPPISALTFNSLADLRDAVAASAALPHSLKVSLIKGCGELRNMKPKIIEPKQGGMSL